MGDSSERDWGVGMLTGCLGGHCKGALVLQRQRASEALEEWRNSYCGLFLILVFGPSKEEARSRAMEYTVTSLTSLCPLTVPPTHSHSPTPAPASSSSSSGGEGTGPEVALYHPRSKSQAGRLFLPRITANQSQRNLGDHLAPPPYANSCKRTQGPGEGW